MGVTKERNKFRARYTHNGKRIQVGNFKTREEAEEAIVKAKWQQDNYLEFEPAPKLEAGKHKLTTIEKLQSWLKARRTR